MKTSESPLHYGEILVEAFTDETDKEKGRRMAWRISPVRALLFVGGGWQVFGKTAVCHEPDRAYREAVNKARNVIKDGRVERIVVRGKRYGKGDVDLACVLAAEIATQVRDPGGLFLYGPLRGETP